LISFALSINVALIYINSINARFIFFIDNTYFFDADFFFLQLPTAPFITDELCQWLKQPFQYLATVCSAVDKSDWRPYLLFLLISHLLVVRLSQNQVQMKDINSRLNGKPVFARFPLKYKSRDGATLRSASSLNRESSEFCSSKFLGATTSVKLTWLQRSSSLLSIGTPVSSL
jgi:hypothetical protein